MPTNDPTVEEFNAQGPPIETDTGGADPQGELDRAMLTQANVSFPSGTAVPKAPRQQPRKLSDGAGGAGSLEDARRGGQSTQLEAEMKRRGIDPQKAEMEGRGVMYQEGAQQGAAPGPVGAPTYAPPPEPPPPPTAPPGTAEAATDVTDFAKEWMETPNRYMSELATKTREVGDARREASREQAGVGISEWAASRGLVGSSYEGEQRVDLEGELDRSRGAEELELQRMMAESESQDRERAGRFAIDAAKYGDTASIERYLAELEGYRAETSYDIDQKMVDARAAELIQQAKTEERELTLAEATLAADKEIRIEQIRQGDESLSLDEASLEADIQIRTAQIRQGDRSLSLEEARHKAEVGFRAEELKQIDKSLSLEEARNKADVEIRMEQIRQGDASLSLDQARHEADVQIRTEQIRQGDRSLSLEEARHDSEVEFRTEELMQSDTSLTLQAARDKADREIRTEQIRVQDDSLSLDEARHKADVQIRTDQIRQGDRSLTLEEARFDAEKEFRTKELMQADTSLSQQAARDKADVEIRTEQIRLQDDSLTLEEARDQANIDFRTKELEQTDTSLSHEEARDQSNIEFRAAQIRQADESLSQQEARDQAEQQWRVDSLNQAARLADREFDTRADEFAKSMGLSRDQFDAQQNQFATSMAEQVSSRLQQQNQFAASLNETVIAREMDTDLRERALKYQEDGMTADHSFRIAQSEIQESQFATTQEFQEAIQTRAQELQETGMNAEIAYRISALDQENTLTKAAQVLTKMGIDNEHTVRISALLQNKEFHDETVRLREYEFGKDDAFRMAQSMIQVDQFATTQEWQEAVQDKAFELQETGMTQDEIFRTAEQTWRQGEADRTREHDIDMMNRANKHHKEMMDELYKKDEEKDTQEKETQNKEQLDALRQDHGMDKTQLRQMGHSVYDLHAMGATRQDLVRWGYGNQALSKYDAIGKTTTNSNNRKSKVNPRDHSPQADEIRREEAWVEEMQNQGMSWEEILELLESGEEPWNVE